MTDTIAYIVGIPIIIVLLVMIVRRARQVNEAVREHLDQQGPVDPYANMAAMANVQQAIDDEKRRSRQAKELLKLPKRPKKQ
ncbi:MAG TPA: hypothetical protein VGK19_15795 [Capsulimonadaceae bacterium]|jgi:hypothetical protein